jgi:condensin complex subunit 2
LKPKFIQCPGDAADTGDPDEDAEPGTEGSKKRAKAHRPEATLAKNAAQLRTKKLELEFTVDPLFKKTCADFDESGAQGLLMNHLALGLGGSLRVVFDAGDSAGAGAEDDEEDPEEPEDPVDLSFLRSKWFPLRLKDRLIDNFPLNNYRRICSFFGYTG